MYTIMGIKHSINTFSIHACTTATSCSDCMADVTGPYRDLTSGTNPATIDLVKINETVLAVFYCSYTCQDYSLSYRYKLDIHIVYDGQLGEGRHKLDSVLLRQEQSHEESTYHYIVNTSEIVTCDMTNNVTTFEIQISVTQVTPILVPQCVVRYNSYECSNLNTFVIIPTVNPTTTTEPSQETTTGSDLETTELSETTQTVNATPAVGQICFSEEDVGSSFGILGIAVVIETAILLTVLIVCLIYKCKKNKPIKTEVIENDATCEKRESKATCTDNSSPQLPNLPHQLPVGDDCSACSHSLNYIKLCSSYKQLNHRKLRDNEEFPL